MRTAIAQARTENHAITFKTFFRIRMWQGRVSCPFALLRVLS